MVFSIVVHGAPYSSQAAATALRFATCALAKGHAIHRVFFYHDGVYTASAATVAPQDEQSPQNGWQNLATEHGVQLAVCIAASLKRGIIDNEGRARHGLPAETAHRAFAIVGLGQLIESIIASDRTVTFAA